MPGTSISPKPVPVNEQVSAEAIRLDFARGWSALGAAWGVAPSTALVQGYLLLATGPLTEADIRASLGLSHRAAFTALAECERWGLVERVRSQRSGRRGPPGRAWAAVGDHWEWFRRVVDGRTQRETDPVLPLLEGCLARATRTDDAELVSRIEALVRFLQQFERGVAAVVESDGRAIAHLFDVLGRLDQATLRTLLASLTEAPADELAGAARSISSMKPATLRRLVRVAGDPLVARILGRLP